MQSYSAHEKPVSCLEINGDDSLLVSGGDDGTVAFAPIFQLVATKPQQSPVLRRFLAHDGSVTSITSCAGLSNTIITTSVDCTEVYAAGSDGSIYKESLKLGRKKTKNRSTKAWKNHHSVVVGLVMVNDGKKLISAAEDGSLYIWETETEQVILDLTNVNMSSTSNLVVANTGSVTDGIGQMKMKKGDDNSFGGEYGGFCVDELSRSLMETVKLEDVLRVAEEDRSRAIEMLESAIAMYERLLELILKEATRGVTDTAEVKLVASIINHINLHKEDNSSPTDSKRP